MNICANCSDESLLKSFVRRDYALQRTVEQSINRGKVRKVTYLFCQDCIRKHGLPWLDNQAIKGINA